MRGKAPRLQGKVIAIQPKWLVLEDAHTYCGMKRDLFRKVAKEKRLTIYAKSSRKMWYKLEELDAMMESFKMTKNFQLKAQ